MKLEGTVSTFGGRDDPGMKYDEGVAFYEHFEADKRTDLFLPRSSDKAQGTSKRLRNTEAYYCALNVETGWERYVYQRSRWKITNLDNGLAAVVWLVDSGPSAAHRLIDLSNAVAYFLRLNTDHVVTVEEATPYGIKFGWYPPTHKS